MAPIWEGQEEIFLGCPGPGPGLGDTKKFFSVTEGPGGLRWGGGAELGGWEEIKILEIFFSSAL